MRVAYADPLVVVMAAVDSCNDTDAADGCSGPGAEDPSRDVPLVLTQGTRSWTLGKAEAGDAATKYASEWKARIPSDVALGSATLTA